MVWFVSRRRRARLTQSFASSRAHTERSGRLLLLQSFAFRSIPRLARILTDWRARPTNTCPCQWETFTPLARTSNTSPSMAITKQNKHDEQGSMTLSVSLHADGRDIPSTKLGSWGTNINWGASCPSEILEDRMTATQSQSQCQHRLLEQPWPCTTKTA